MDLSELYQDLILDHGKRPRNVGELPGHNREAQGFNPLCGDKLTLYLRVDDGKVKDAKFVGKSCAICTASASMMTEELAGHSEAEARELFTRFHDLMTGKITDEQMPESMDRLLALGGVRRFPMRVKCATLPWHTLIAALDNQHQTVKTE